MNAAEGAGAPLLTLETRQKQSSSEESAKPNGLDSVSYDSHDSAVFESSVLSLAKSGYSARGRRRWLLLLFVGVAVGVTATFITWLSRTLTALKYDLLSYTISASSSGVGTPLAAFLACSLAYGVVAAGLACYEPAASGSGIPEIKAVLNGLKLPHVLAPRTLLCKAVGNSFSVASGLPVGKEGPLIHSGAILAAMVNEAAGRVLRLREAWKPHLVLRSAAESRDFILAGAAAGVAAAFGTPVGGVLFAVEEGATYWRRGLTWRLFMTCLIAAYTVDYLLSGLSGNWGLLSRAAMFSFGSFGTDAQGLYQDYEILLFAAVGAVCGLIGAAFVAVNRRITTWRLVAVPVSAPWRRFGEAVAIIFFNTVLKLLVPYFAGTCHPLPATPKGEEAANFVRLNCAAGSYSDLATLFLNSSEDAIKALFHVNSAFISAGGLAAFWALYTVLCALAYGIAVPAGLFLPSLLSGAALGRLIGVLLAGSAGDSSTFADPTVYAVVGASAMLAGTTRLTISIAVIVLEGTSNYSLAMPIFFAVMASRYIGNAFNDSVYDLHIKLRQWPVLEERAARTFGHALRACDCMTKPPVVMAELESVGRVLQVLATTKHHAFPVVHSAAVLRAHPRLGSFAGLITRHQLLVMLERKAWHAGLPQESFTNLYNHQQPAEPALSSAFSISLAGVHLPPPPSPPPPASAYSSSALISTSAATTAQGGAPAASPSSRRPRGSTNGSGPSSGTLSKSNSMLALDASVRIRLPSVPSMNADALLQQPAVQRDSGSALRFVPDADVVELVYTDEPQLSCLDFLPDPHHPVPDLQQLQRSTTATERDYWLDLRPYCDPSPVTVHVHAPLHRVYSLFRGLRHLVVVNDAHDVCGIITRANLLQPALEQALEARYNRRYERQASWLEQLQAAVASFTSSSSGAQPGDFDGF